MLVICLLQHQSIFTTRMLSATAGSPVMATPSRGKLPFRQPCSQPACWLLAVIQNARQAPYKLHLVSELVQDTKQQAVCMLQGVTHGSNP